MSTKRLHATLTTLVAVVLFALTAAAAFAEPLTDPVKSEPKTSASVSRAGREAYFAVKEIQADRADAASLRSERRATAARSVKSATLTNKYGSFKLQQAERVMNGERW